MTQRCPHCAIEVAAADLKEDMPSRFTKPRRSDFHPDDWLVGHTRVKDALIESIAVGAIYFETAGELRAAYLEDQIAALIPSARTYEVEYVVLTLVKDRIRQLLAANKK